MCQSGYENYDPTINVSDRLSDNEYYVISKMKLYLLKKLKKFIIKI